MKTITLLPAYGRDYTSRKAVIADLLAGKDFIIADLFNPHDGRYASIVELREDNYSVLNIRYKNKRQVAVIKMSQLKGEK